MNNTFCVGIFLGLIFGRGLAWEFSAETISIVFIEIVMWLLCMKKTHRLLDGFIVLSLYPLSLIIVIILEKASVLVVMVGHL